MFILFSVTLRRVVFERKSQGLASWWHVVASLPGHALLRGLTVRRVGIYNDIDLLARRHVRTPGRDSWQGEFGDLKLAAVRGPGGLERKDQIRWITGII